MEPDVVEAAIRLLSIRPAAARGFIRPSAEQIVRRYLQLGRPVLKG